MKKEESIKAFFFSFLLAYNLGRKGAQIETKEEHKIEHKTYVDVQPMSGFSHLSWLSNVMTHLRVLRVPDCMLLRGGMATRARRPSNTLEVPTSLFRSGARGLCEK
jgi:hypothetical protein